MNYSSLQARNLRMTSHITEKDEDNILMRKREGQCIYKCSFVKCRHIPLDESQSIRVALFCPVDACHHSQIMPSVSLHVAERIFDTRCPSNKRSYLGKSSTVGLQKNTFQLWDC